MNVRVLIPSIRRALVGPEGTIGDLSDAAAKDLAADAIADVLFYTGGAWPHTLIVEGVDEDYGAPVEWLVEPDLDPAESRVVVAQAALNFFFTNIREAKVSETITNEAQTWAYTKSSSVISDQLKLLREMRDQALEQIMGAFPQTYDLYVSFLEVRDRATARQIEPWVTGGSFGGQEDTRFLAPG